MKRIVAVLDQWWFPVVSPVRLAVIRILTGIFSVWYISRRGQWLDPFEKKAVDLFEPIGLTTLISGPLAPNTVEFLGILTTVLGVMFILGFWWRLVGPAFAALFMFTLTYKNSWGMLFHTENMFALHIVVLGFMPSARVFAVDPWIRKKWTSPLLGWLGFCRGGEDPHWKMGSAIRMLQLVTTLPYVVAGFAKVLGPAGWGWAIGTNLRDQVAMNGIWYAMTTRKVREITFYIYDYDWPWTLLAIVTLIAEFCAPLAMLHRRLGYFFVAMVLGLHWGIDILMAIAFKYQMCGLAFACFFEWERIVSWISPKLDPIRSRFRGSGGQ